MPILPVYIRTTTQPFQAYNEKNLSKQQHTRWRANMERHSRKKQTRALKTHAQSPRTSYGNKKNPYKYYFCMTALSLLHQGKPFHNMTRNTKVKKKRKSRTTKNKNGTRTRTQGTQTRTSKFQQTPKHTRYPNRHKTT